MDDDGFFMKVPAQISTGDQEVDLEKVIADVLEKLLAPVVGTICEMEQIRRKEYLTETEAALLFSLSAATLKTQRSRKVGPPYIKAGSRILYPKEELARHLSGLRINNHQASTWALPIS